MFSLILEREKHWFTPRSVKLLEHLLIFKIAIRNRLIDFLLIVLLCIRTRGAITLCVFWCGMKHFYSISLQRDNVFLFHLIFFLPMVFKNKHSHLTLGQKICPGWNEQRRKRLSLSRITPPGKLLQMQILVWNNSTGVSHTLVSFLCISTQKQALDSFFCQDNQK